VQSLEKERFGRIYEQRKSCLLNVNVNDVLFLMIKCARVCVFIYIRILPQIEEKKLIFINNWLAFNLLDLAILLILLL